MSYCKGVIKLKKVSKDEYKKAILRFLAKSHEPTDVEKIRVRCKIGNWQTALKHCLELLYDEKIRGAKTSKSWVFWKRKCEPSFKTGQAELDESLGGEAGDR